MIYGKIFGTMFEGSMVGAGSHVFAVMAYVISHMQPGPDKVEFVRLQPTILGAVIGEDEAEIEKAISYLCKPDPKTTTEGEGGRRLIQVEQFVYRVVNGKHYRSIVDLEDKLAKAAKRQADYRARKAAKNKGKPLPGENKYLKILKEQGQAAADAYQDSFKSKSS